MPAWKVLCKMVVSKFSCSIPYPQFPWMVTTPLLWTSWIAISSWIVIIISYQVHFQNSHIAQFRLSSTHRIHFCHIVFVLVWLEFFSYDMYVSMIGERSERCDLVICLSTQVDISTTAPYLLHQASR